MLSADSFFPPIMVEEQSEWTIVFVWHLRCYTEDEQSLAPKNNHVVNTAAMSVNVWIFFFFFFFVRVS